VCVCVCVCVCVQVQDLLLAILCSTSIIVLLLGVLTRFVLAAAQARLMWGACVRRRPWRGTADAPAAQRDGSARAAYPACMRCMQASSATSSQWLTMRRPSAALSRCGAACAAPCQRALACAAPRRVRVALSRCGAACAAPCQRALACAAPVVFTRMHPPRLQVVRTRTSASIYRPTCIANLANAALWVAYGVVSCAWQLACCDC
jgi:hypothetical protein